MLSHAFRSVGEPKASGRAYPRAGLAGAGASASARTLLGLQSLAGNRAVAELVGLTPNPHPRKIAADQVAVQRCGDQVHTGCSCAEPGTDDPVQRLAGATPQDAPADAAPSGADSSPECPSLPDPHGDWMTEPWLCEMRREPMYSNDRLLAPGASGRSVELLHRVLQDWICLKTADGDPPAHTLPDWRSGLHTKATSDVVEDFQNDVGATMREGIVGPETLSLLDGHVGGPDPARIPAECRPERKDVPRDECPPRESGEEAASASEKLTLHKGAATPSGRESQVQTFSIKGFTADDPSIDKGPARSFDDLADLLDPASLTPFKAGTEVECWEFVTASVFGFTECNEEPSVGRARADAVAAAVTTRVPGLELIVDEVPDSPAGNATAEGRHDNRSAVIIVERRLKDVVDLSGSALDDLLQEATRRRADLEGRYGERVIKMAALLADGANDEFIGKSGAGKISKMELAAPPHPDCTDFETYPWESAREAIARLIVRQVDAGDICAGGVPGSVRQLMDALEELHADMADALFDLRFEAADRAISSESYGCACYALQWLWRRTLDPGDIYKAMANHQNFEGDPTSENCSTV